MASEIIEADRLHLLLLSDGARVDDNEYLESLENATEVIVCTEEKIRKLSNLFWGKKIFKQQKHILSIKHRLFFMAPALWLASSGGYFFKITDEYFIRKQ